MDINEAKFILQSFRPNGSDTDDSSFTEALALATQDRELGEWLAKERATDAVFAAALSSIEIPEDLRDDIIGALSGENANISISAVDGDFIGALAQVRPPADLRASILAGMNAENTPAEKPKNVISPAQFSLRHWATGLAAAAVVIFAATLAFRNTPDTATHQVAQNTPSQIITADAEMKAGAAFIRDHFSKASLDLMSENPREVMDYLSSKTSVRPLHLPEMFSNSPSIGCKTLVLDGKPASLICYMTNDHGVVHLVTFHRKDVPASLCNLEAAGKNCKKSKCGEFAIACWADEQNAYFVYAPSSTPEKLSRVF